MTKKFLKSGETITFMTTATNLGPDAATGITLSIGVSDSYHNLGSTCPDGLVSDRCELGTLVPGASVTVYFRAMAANACCPDRLGVAVTSVFPDVDSVDSLIPANNEVRRESGPEVNARRRAGHNGEPTPRSH